MSMFFRCDGCGGEVARPGVSARRAEQMIGDELPPVEFHWCGLCSRAAFRAVQAEAERRRRQIPAGEMVPGVAAVPQDRTRVMQGPAAHVANWLPRRSHRDRELEDTRIVGEHPQ